MSIGQGTLLVSPVQAARITNIIANGGIDTGIHIISEKQEKSRIISEKTADLAGEALDASGIYAQVSVGMADFILNGISFFIAFAVGMIVLHFFSGILGIVSRIPIIRGINKYLGTVAGAIYGFVVVWIAFYVIALCSTSEVGGALISYIYESPFLTYIYENNLIVALIMMFL